MDRPENSIPLNATVSQAGVENDLDAQIAEAVNEYEALLRSGATPDLKSFLARYRYLEPGLSECIEAINFVGNAVAKRAILRNLSPLGQMTQLGDFQILRKVGGGGMGDVYEAHQLSLARRVALKVMSSALSSNQHSLKRFQHEAQAAAMLQHPHIVPVYFVGQVDKHYFYAMQFIDGATVADLLLRFRSRAHILSDTRSVSARDTSEKTSSFPVDGSAGTVVNEQSSTETHRDGYEANEEIDHHPLLSLDPKSTAYFRAVARLIQQAAEALQHAHDNGIIHRDIKPSNLLIDLKGNAWVADFGLARLPDSNLTATSDVLGTIRYMSPEQASGRAVALDGRTDVYSLGATLYELLTLKPLFESEDRQSLLKKVIESEPITLRQHCPHLSRDLETITLKALAKDVEQRYVSAAELAADLDRFLTDRPIQAQPPTAKQIIWKWLRRNRTIVIGLAILIVLILLVTIIATTLALNRISKANRLTVDANQRLATALEEKDSSLYRANMILARRDWDDGSHAGARARLDATSERHRKWEWQYLNALCNQPTKEFDSESFIDLPMAVSQDGQRILGYRPLQTETLLSIDPVPDWNGQRTSGMRFKPGLKGFEFHFDRGYTFCGSGEFAAAIETDKLVSVLRTGTGELVHLLPAPLPIQGAITVEDDGNVLAPLATKDKTEIWDLGRFTKLSEFDDTTRVRCWSNDRDRIYQDSGAIRESLTGKGIAKVNEIVRASLASGGCRFSPDGKILVGSSKNGVRVLDANTAFERFHFTDAVIGNLMAFSPDGMRLATGGYDRSLRVYELLTGRLQMKTYNDIRPLVLAFQADGTTLISATHLQQKLWNCLDMVEGETCVATNPTNLTGENEVFCEGRVGTARALQRMDTRDNTTIETFELPTQESVNAEVCPKTLIAALRTKLKTLLWDLNQKRLIAELPTFSSYTMRFSEDGKWLITDSGFANPTVVVVDVGQGKVARNLEHPGGFARCFRISRDSSQVIVGYQSGDVIAWDIASGDKLWTTRRHLQAVTAIDINSTNRFVASAGTNEVINILDIKNGELMQTLKGHSSQISALAFHPTQARLATAGEDSVIRVWDIENWEPIFEIPSVTKSERLAFTPSGDRLVSLQIGAVVSFGVKGTKTREQQRQEWLYRSLTQAERLKNSFAAEWFLKELIKVDSKNAELVSRLAAVQQQRQKSPATSLTPERSGPLVAHAIDSLSIRAMDRVYAVAANHALLRDPKAVRQVADHIVGQIDEKNDGWIASLAYRLYLFAPTEASQIAELISAFEKQTQAYKSQLAAHMVRGGLQYRAGQYELALDSLLQAEKFEAESKSHVINWLLLSMTQSQLGNLTEAEKWLTRARQWRISISAGDFSKLDFQVRLPFLVLSLEAAELLAQKQDGPKPKGS